MGTGSHQVIYHSRLRKTEFRFWRMGVTTHFFIQLHQNSHWDGCMNWLKHLIRLGDRVKLLEGCGLWRGFVVGIGSGSVSAVDSGSVVSVGLSSGFTKSTGGFRAGMAGMCTEIVQQASSCFFHSEERTSYPQNIGTSGFPHGLQKHIFNGLFNSSLPGCRKL